MTQKKKPNPNLSDIGAEAMKLLDEIIADLAMRARLDATDGETDPPLDISNGLVRRYYELKERVSG